MDHIWKVRQSGVELGEVKAISMKGAETAAYAKFQIPASQRRHTRVTKVPTVIAIDPASQGGDCGIMAEVRDGLITNMQVWPPVKGTMK